MHIVWADSHERGVWMHQILLGKRSRQLVSSKTSAKPECKLPGLSSLRRVVWAMGVGWGGEGGSEEWVEGRMLYSLYLLPGSLTPLLCSSCRITFGRNPNPSTRAA